MTADATTPPHAPGRLPVVGHVMPLLRNRLAFMQQLRGHGDVVQIRVGPRPVFVVNSPELIWEMLTAQSANFGKGRLFDKLRLFGGSPLPVAEGQQHLQRRRLMQPSFHRERINSYIDTMSTTAEAALRTWEHGTRLDVLNEMQLMTQGVVMSVLFSSDPERGPAQAIMNSVDTVFQAAIRRAVAPVSAWENLPLPGNRRLRAANALLRRTVGDIVAARRTEPEHPDDLVSLLLDARDEDGRPLDDDEILSEITALLAAGSETTAVTMAWLLHELGRNPDLEERLHQEVDTVLAGDRLTADHLPRLLLTRRLVTETLRLHNPGWIVTRQATVPVRLGTALLPAGADLVWSPYTLHRDPELYHDPLRFDPDRWLPDRPQPPRGAYIPFGAGKRMCIGDGFTWAEATVLTALVASRWTLRHAPGATVRPVPAITVHPSSLHMIAEARGTAAARTAA
ncbi:cytochrome P450 [Kitasatospora sp. NBC_00240]|uniref:cytochrome P450 n=1 Tax=Kitasatospora sp. NBC_00240 TaxID=2903567 RepID=UPI002259341E|nr:cytochrome P450 [Kitasatospora sp. NBC_00240]MCX5216047.1 cytochrome P450 [Kitasatospora sp. NBC_00240]